MLNTENKNRLIYALSLVIESLGMVTVTSRNLLDFVEG